MRTATGASSVSSRRPAAHSAPLNTSPLLDDDVDPAHMTFDELEMQRSRHFVQALKELKNLRPQLYSAAEYCESSYLHSDQKQVVLDNLKDYSVKALVNAVDHLGTVAYKLNDLLGQQSTEISATELRAASVAQRMRSCQEHSDREGLKQQSLAKTMHANHKHYFLPDPCAGELNPPLFREKFELVHPRQYSLKVHPHRPPTSHLQPLPLAKESPLGSCGSELVAWPFTPETAPTSTSDSSNFSRLPISAGERTSPTVSCRSLEASLSKNSSLTPSHYNVDLVSSLEADVCTSEDPASAISSSQRSGFFAPVIAASTRGTSILRSFSMVRTTHAGANSLVKDSRNAQAPSRSLLRSLLRRKSSKTLASRPA